MQAALAAPPQPLEAEEVVLDGAELLAERASLLLAPASPSAAEQPQSEPQAEENSVQQSAEAVRARVLPVSAVLEAQPRVSPQLAVLPDAMAAELQPLPSSA